MGLLFGDEWSEEELRIQAAHELGHAILARAGKIRVRAIEVGPAWTYRDLPKNYHLEKRKLGERKLRYATVGQLAGWEAEVMWCRLHGGRPDRSCSETDFKNFRADQEYAGITEDYARRKARKVLKRYWHDLEELVPVLVKERKLKDPW